MIRRLAQASVDHPVTVHLTSLLLLAAGVGVYLTSPREIFPEFTRERIRVTTLLPSASSEDVEELVTVRIEDAVHGIEGVELVESVSQEGLSVVTARLEHGTDTSRVLDEVDRAVAAVADLPDDAEEPLVEEVRTRFPVITLSIYGDVSELALKDLVRPIRRQLEAIPGVASVRPTGMRELETHVEVDPDALDRFGVTLEEVARALGAENVTVPGGALEGGHQDVLVRTRRDTRTPEEVEAVVVRGAPGGALVRVGDVARVRPGFERALTYGRFNGKPALNLTALKEADGDILVISARVREVARTLELPAGVHAAVHTDLSVFLDERIRILQTNALQGLVLILLCLCALLSWRMAVLVALGIPAAFLVCLLGMRALGISVNMMSLFGMILVLGMLVDDAIVVGENVFRRIEAGEPPAVAAVNGTVEVAGPVVATVVTTVSAFLPMLLTGGELGQWVWQVPVVVSLCLGASLLECFAVLPCHVAELARPSAPRTGAAPGWFERVLVVYERCVRFVVTRRYETLALVVGLSLLLAAWAATSIRFVLIGKFESDTYFLNFELPSTVSLEETSERARELERIVLALPGSERAACVTNVGLSAVDVNQLDRGNHLGQVVFTLVPQSQRERSASEIVAQLREACRGLTGFTKLEFKGLNAGPGGAAIEVALEGDDMARLRAAAAAVQAWLRDQPGVHDVHDDSAPGKLELEVRVDPEAARALGLTAAAIGLQVRDAFRGREATSVRRLDEDVDLVVRFPRDARAERRTLEDLWLTTPSGQRVPFQAVASVRERRGLAKVVRADRRRAITVLADVDPARANALQVSDRLLERFGADLPRTYGVDLRLKGQRRENEQSMQGMRAALGLSSLLILLILGTQFRSYSQPVMVMLAIPFGFGGIFFGHALLDLEFSFLSMMGLVATAGIAVNDSIVLVDAVNRFRQDGMSTTDAAVGASVRRLRPIFLTTITTIGGLTPLAFFSSGQAKFLSPMAVSLVFGLAFSTLLTLLVIPCLYVVLEDLRGAVGLGRSHAAEPGPEASHEPAAGS